MKEKVANQGITQVLREDASPLWSELHRSSFCGEAHTALRGWRPISAALSTPVPLLFVRGRKTSLINHWASRPIYNRGSIRESVRIVKLIPSKNISARVACSLLFAERLQLVGVRVPPSLSRSVRGPRNRQEARPVRPDNPVSKRERSPFCPTTSPYNIDYNRLMRR